MTVTVQREKLSLKTYGVGAPEKNPTFFEKRVYQGSCGKVYPLPFIDKVHDEAHEQDYDSIRLENEFVRVVLLPELGGRIYLAQDKTNNDYNFFYKNDVIKPALVGLAGPWLSGGVEFNWPQHHRPGTYMPTDVEIEKEDDGSITVWMSEHDPIERLKGMHGIRLKPNSALIELRARLYNRTPLTQTFLWWANVAAEVHEQYQSFFPPDVHHVADHAARAISSFPQANNPYYGIDYQDRPQANDLTRYSNIPVPTSYMVCNTQYDFFGGYDSSQNGGFIHVANRHIAPGKKQWTWGNHDFGWAWDRELTDDNGPYVELMAGVYTDNQPDFTYLKPYETKTFSQFWWGFKNLGPVQNANHQLAIRLSKENTGFDIGVAASEALEDLEIEILQDDARVHQCRSSISPDQPWQLQDKLDLNDDQNGIAVIVKDAQGQVLLSYTHHPTENEQNHELPDAATEAPAPRDITSIEELYLTGEHLEQYRHPTRDPEDYWREAINRDALDSRSRTALGRFALKKGCFQEAVDHLRLAVQRLTRRHPNPVTGEAHYFLGLSLHYQKQHQEAYAALYKATWSYEWRSCAYYQLALLDLKLGDSKQALEHLKLCLSTNSDHNQAQVLMASIWRRQGQKDKAMDILNEVLQRDPLDLWAIAEQDRLGHGQKLMDVCRNDAQSIIDICLDDISAGAYTEALALIETHERAPQSPCATPNPLQRSNTTTYLKAWLLEQVGDTQLSRDALKTASKQSSDYFFPSRLEEQIVLEWAIEAQRQDANAAYALGNFYYDRKRHHDAIASWENAQQWGSEYATVYRNLGIGYWNIHRDAEAALKAYASAVTLNPNDPRLCFEHDQLRKKCEHKLQDRLDTLLTKKNLVLTRDDACVELARLYNQTQQPEKALELLMSRRFHPWEGGEGQVLEQYTSARLQLGQQCLSLKQADKALEHFQLAMQTPDNLGEAYHLLQAKANVNYWLGMAHRALGQEEQAISHFEQSAAERGDFQGMAVTEHSELSYDRGLSLLELKRYDEAEQLFNDIIRYAEQLKRQPAVIDYFATSLPDLLVFEDDLNEKQHQRAERLLQLGQKGRELVEQVQATPAMV